MVTRFDAYVGEIMQTLKRLGLDKNTIVFFASDNGPHQEGGADPDFSIVMVLFVVLREICMRVVSVSL